AALLTDGVSPPPQVRWAAVGAVTAEALASRGVRVACVPDTEQADAVPEAMARVADLHGARVLLARADLATPSLPARLRELGADVDDVVAYRTAVAPESSRAAMVEAFGDPELE